MSSQRGGASSNDGEPHRDTGPAYTGAPMPSRQNGAKHTGEPRDPATAHGGHDEQAPQRASQQRAQAQADQGKGAGRIRCVRHLRQARRQDIEDTASDERRGGRAHTGLTRRRSVQLRELQAHSPHLQQDEERQDRRTRTSAAGRQTNRQAELAAVQNIRHLIRNTLARYHSWHLVREPRVQCRFPSRKSNVGNGGNVERSESEGRADEVRAVRQRIPAFRPWAAAALLLQVLPPEGRLSSEKEQARTGGEAEADGEGRAHEA
nr:MAG TPA: hypothetical protein [Caudoviricetes sp.]